MIRLDPDLIKKLSQKLNKNPQYIREQISKRAAKHHISSEAELAIWANEHAIWASNYIRKLAPHIQNQVNSYFSPSKKDISTSKSSGFRFFIQTDKKSDHWYNLWWVQLTVAFLLVGIIAGTISQVLGAFFVDLFGMTNP